MTTSRMIVRWIACLAALCSACGGNTDAPEAVEKTKRLASKPAKPETKAAPTPTEANVLSRCHGDPNPCVTDTLFEILGMMREYNGRGSGLSGGLPAELVDSFFFNESTAAEAFETLVAAYEKEVGMRFDVKRKEDAVIEFRSKSLCGLLNSFYKKNEERRNHTLDRALIESATTAQKQRYIAGVYQRFGVKSPKVKALIRMVNAFDKAKTVGQTLKSLGCSEVASYATPTMPVANLVRFVPSDELKALLKIEAVPTEAEMSAEYSNLAPSSELEDKAEKPK